MTRRCARCALLSCLLMGCGGDDTPPPSSGAAPDAGVMRIAVEVGQVELGQLESETSSVGIVEAWQSASLRAETGGRVEAVRVDNGSTVEAGALLVEIDSSRQRIAVDAARAQVEGLEEDLAFARSEAERKRKLVERGSAASVTLDAAEHAVTKARAGLAAARAQLRSSQRQLSDGRVKAPFAGVVTSRMVDAGDTTAPGAPLMEVVDLSRLRVRVGVSGAELAALQLGDTAEVRIEDLGGRKIDARVHAIAPAAHPVTGLFDVELEAPNPDGDVRAGMVASVRLSGAARQERSLAPRQALTRRGGRTVVFEIVDGVARMRPVIVGFSGSERVEIVEGIGAGARVAVSALHSLAEGVEVEPLTREGGASVASAMGADASPAGEGPKADASSASAASEGEAR